MKKTMTAVLTVLMLFTTACGRTKDSADTKAEAYKAYYEILEGASVYQQSSDYYEISAEMSDPEDHMYRYYVFIDSPRVAMYNCKVMAIENGEPYSDQRIMPSVGITDTPYALVPNQVNNEGGYAKGLIISGETRDSSVELKLMVEWTPKNNSTVMREFFRATVSSDGITFSSDTEPQEG